MHAVRLATLTVPAILAAALTARAVPPPVRLLGHHPAGKQPTTVTLLHGGKELAVGNRGDSTVWVYDTESMNVVKRYSLVDQHGVWDAAELPDGALLVSNWVSETLSVLDRATGTVTGTHHVGIKPSYVAVSPDGKRAFAAGYFSGDLSLVDLEAGRTMRTLELGQKPMGVVLSPDGRWLFAASCQSNKISKVDLKYEVVLDNWGAPLAETTNLAVTPDGSHLLAAGRNDRILVVDVESGDVDKIKVGKGPAAVAVSPDGETAFVACYDGGTVGVVDLITRQMHREIPVGHGPIGLATDGKRLYACSDQAGGVTVFELGQVVAAELPEG